MYFFSSSFSFIYFFSIIIILCVCSDENLQKLSIGFSSYEELRGRGWGGAFAKEYIYIFFFSPVSSFYFVI